LDTTMKIDTSIRLLASRRTKIVATIGPASDTSEMLHRLLEAGADVFRLNMSHGSHAHHGATLARIRETAANHGKHVAVLADLAGPKIRVGRFADGGIELVDGDAVTLTTRDVLGEHRLIPSQYDGLANDVTAGDRILLADGLLELRVASVAGTEIHCTVVQGGTLSDRKGINLPGVKVTAPSMTEKDIADARFLLSEGVEYLGLSFVRHADDVTALKKLVADRAGAAAVVAKIERPEALDNANEILDVCDGIMVARGDLGVELPPETVPVAQRQLVDRARAHNKPVIVATQMLESMIDNPRPTRAEVADVSNSVFSGADAIMLSAETASGDHPVLAVGMMNRVARQSEGYLWTQGAFESLAESPAGDDPIRFGDAVARSVALLSRDLRVRAIVAISHSGMSAATLSAARPSAPVLVVSRSELTCRQMSLLWGVIPVCVDATTLDDPTALTRTLVVEHQLAEPGQFVLLVRGFHADPVKNTPSITLLSV
jgi:pyruvate kinase